ncbi:MULTISPECIES: hypothetical protein [unclassified Sinorhizobium]|uniref:hypothetical protein n=1 Tax=unclassified Sinorhizobium TaxID=2613772 RepID=UPI003525D6D4
MKKKLAKIVSEAANRAGCSTIWVRARAIRAPGLTSLHGDTLDDAVVDCRTLDIPMARNLNNYTGGILAAVCQEMMEKRTGFGVERRRTESDHARMNCKQEISIP